MLYRLFWMLSWISMKCILAYSGGYRVRGTEKIPLQGRLIVTPNHLSFADPPFVGLTCRRFPWYMSTHELFAYRILGKLATIMRAFPIKQDSPDRAALRKTEQLLEAGNAVVVFPEGHVSVSGDLQPLQLGVLLLAWKTGTPILPVGIAGTSEMMPARTWHLKRTKTPVAIVYGEVLTVDALFGGGKGREALERGSETLRSELNRLIAEAKALRVAS